MTIEIDTSRDVQKTLGLIKPDAVEQGFEDEIKERIIDEGFTIIRSEKICLTRERASMFYKEHDGKEFFEGLLDFMTSGPIVVLVLCKHNAIAEWRKLMGPTDVLLAKEQYPNSLRALYGTSKTFNGVHGSDSPTSARREIKFFFPNMSVDPIPSSKQATADYIQEHLNSILVQGLTELAKKKPEEPVKWLANWLLSHNPNQPEIIEPLIHEESEQVYAKESS